MPNVQLPTGETIAMPDNPTPQDISDFQQAVDVSQRRAIAQTPSATDGPQGFMNGLGELAVKGLLSVPYAAMHGARDLAAQVRGDPETPDPNWLKSMHPDLSDNALRAAQSIGSTSFGQTAQKVYQAAQTAEPDLTRMATNVAAVVPGVDMARGIGGEIAGAAGRMLPEAGSGLNELGLAGQDQITARRLANDTTVNKAAALQNQAVANARGGEVVGTPLGDAGAQARLIEARAPANAVYNRVANQIPATNLAEDADTAAAINAAGSGGSRVKGSPASQAAVAAAKDQLLNGGPISGQELVDTQRSLRNDGFAGRNSADPDQQHLGQAKLDMARALEDHMQRNLPAGADVTPEQFQQARTALAQSHTVQDALTPGGNLDLQKLARFDADNPGVLTGHLKSLASFAAENPITTRATDSVIAPDAVRELMGAASVHSPIRTAVQGLGGGMLARRIISGGDAAAAARTPNIGPIGGGFAPVDPLRNGLAPPPGQVGPPLQRGLDLGEPPPAPPPAAPPVGLSVGEGVGSKTPHRPGPATRSGYSDLATELAPPPAAPPVGLSVGEGVGSRTPHQPGPATRSGYSDLATELTPPPPVGLSVGEGVGSRTPHQPGPATRSGYSDLATELAPPPAAPPVGLSVGEGVGSRTPHQPGPATRSGYSDLATDLAPPPGTPTFGLSVGEGVGSKTPHRPGPATSSGYSDLADDLEHGLNVGGAGKKRRGK